MELSRKVGQNSGFSSLPQSGDPKAFEMDVSKPSCLVLCKDFLLVLYAALLSSLPLLR